MKSSPAFAVSDFVLPASVLLSLGLGLSAAHGQHLISYVDGKAPVGEIAHRVVGVGDLDSDGVPDIMAFAAIYSDSGNYDHLLVLSGADGHTLFELAPPPAADPTLFADDGHGMDRAGDVDGDGVPDLLVGHPGSDSIGSAYVYSGANGSVIRTWHGGATYEFFGSTVAGLGDVNGDGLSDVAVGMPFWSSQTHVVRVFSGATGSLLATLHAEGPVSEFGSTLALAGDSNGDGVPDLAVTDQLSQSVFVISGASIGNGVPQTLWHVGAPTFAGSFGLNLDAAGDVNGDGRDDLLVSSEGNVAGPTPGEVYVLSGADGSVLLTLKASGQGEVNFGRSVAGLGDVNGDGTPDLAVGSWPGPSPSTQSNVTIHSGLDGSTLCSIFSDAPAGTTFSDGIGETVSRVGDMDGDGLADIVVGASRGNPTSVDPFARGRFYVFGVGSSWTWLGQSKMSSVGTSVLIGEGVAVAGQPLDLELSNAPANTPGVLVVGLTEVLADVKGGTLVPSPDFLVLFSTDAVGIARWTGNWPAALLPGLQLSLQAWLPDAASPVGWSASSALRVES